MKLRIGFRVLGQGVAWDELVDAAVALERLGFDSAWSTDHFLPLALGVGGTLTPYEGPTFEAWTTLAGWAAATERIRLGCLVSAASYRNPALVVKMATGLDHLSRGRMTLGLGAGWAEKEHRAFGFPFPPAADRLGQLSDAATIARGLLDGEAVTHAGAWYSAKGARNDPAPVQARLPLLIATGGEKKALGIVAAHADAWNADGGDIVALRRASALLDEQCEAVGRPPRAIRRTASQGLAMIRESKDEAVAALAESLSRHRTDWTAALELGLGSRLVGTVEDVVAALAPISHAGFDEVIFDLPLPFDRPTLEALAGPVRAEIARLLA